MDISDIDLIRTVSKSGSLTHSSSILNTSQPTLSKKLARLEDQLNAQLFHRSTTGLVPTEVANYIVSKSEPLRGQLTEIERHVELMTQLETGTVNLGVGPIIEQILLPSVLSEFIATTGDVALSIVTEDDETLLELFEASSLDLVVGPFRADDWQREGFMAIPMITDEVVAAARVGHPIFEYKTIDEKVLNQFPWAAPKTPGTTRQAKGGPSLQDPKILSDNYDLLKKVTVNSDVLCAAPRAVFKEEMERGLLRELNVDLKVTWESALIIRAETLATALPKHAVGLFEAASEQVRDLLAA